MEAFFLITHSFTRRGNTVYTFETFLFYNGDVFVLASVIPEAFFKTYASVTHKTIESFNITD